MGDWTVRWSGCVDLMGVERYVTLPPPRGGAPRAEILSSYVRFEDEDGGMNFWRRGSVTVRRASTWNYQEVLLEREINDDHKVIK
jgi:hypothetical protein